jgi:hypothetical protein
MYQKIIPYDVLINLSESELDWILEFPEFQMANQYCNPENFAPCQDHGNGYIKV